MGEKAMEFYKRAIKSLAKLRHGSAKLFTEQIRELWQILAERQDETDRRLGIYSHRLRQVERELCKCPNGPSAMGPFVDECPLHGAKAERT